MEYYRILWCWNVFEYYGRPIPKYSMVLKYDGIFTNILPQQWSSSAGKYASTMCHGASQYLQWIGLIGKILTGNHRVFFSNYGSLNLRAIRARGTSDFTKRTWINMAWMVLHVSKIYLMLGYPYGNFHRAMHSRNLAWKWKLVWI